VSARRLPRIVHPIAWWIWALGLATAASLTTNPLLLALVLAVAGLVVAARRTDAPWARAFRAYLVLGLVVVAIRIVFKIVLGGSTVSSEHVVVHLPEVPLPGFLSGVSLGGPVTAESIVAAVYDGMRLATLLCCIGAANALANPKRALRSLPAALYEVGVAITVAVVIAPQLVESVQRVRRARKLRGATEKGRRAVRGIAMPVLHDSLDRSFALAAAMDARGYGRNATVPVRTRRVTTALLLIGLTGLCVGAYAILDPTTPRVLGVPMLALGLLSAAGGMALGGKRVKRTQYRPDPWAGPEWATAACGVVAAVSMIVTGRLDAGALDPSVYPLAWPALPLLPVLGLAVALLPAVVTPPPPRAHVAPVHDRAVDLAAAGEPEAVLA
jgi:energy-coupling factor transport system permease protein